MNIVGNIVFGILMSHFDTLYWKGFLLQLPSSNWIIEFIYENIISRPLQKYMALSLTPQEWEDMKYFIGITQPKYKQADPISFTSQPHKWM